MPLRAERLPGKVVLLLLLFHVGSGSIEQVGPTTHRRPPAASTHGCSRKSLLIRYSSQLSSGSWKQKLGVLTLLALGVALLSTVSASSTARRGAHVRRRQVAEGAPNAHRSAGSDSLRHGVLRRLATRTALPPQICCRPTNASRREEASAGNRLVHPSKDGGGGGGGWMRRAASRSSGGWRLKRRPPALRHASSRQASLPEHSWPRVQRPSFSLSWQANSTKLLIITCWSHTAEDSW